MSELLHMTECSGFRRGDRLAMVPTNDLRKWWHPWVGKRVVIAASGEVLRVRGYNIFDWVADLVKRCPTPEASQGGVSGKE